MSEGRVSATLATVEATVQAAKSQPYVLVLYVSGIRVHSQEAIENLTAVAEDAGSTHL